MMVIYAAGLVLTVTVVMCLSLWGSALAFAYVCDWIRKRVKR